jgi:HD-GYP domain-containing protein (c-di-GMP phosphodiesterase class II)
MGAPKLEAEPVRHKILIAEDQLDIFNIVKFTLESEYSFDILWASDGFKAIEILNANRDIQLVLCDHTMEPGNARTVYEWIKDQNLEIPFVFTSGTDVTNFQGFEEAGDSVKGVKKKNLLGKLPELIQAFFEVDVKIPPKEFTGISVETLLTFERLHEDIYIQLSSGRYLKYYSSEDSVNNQDVNKLRKKEVKKLYLKKQALSWIKRELVDNFPEVVEGKVKLENLLLRKPVTEEKLKVTSPFEYEKEFLDEVEAQRDRTLKKISMNPRLRALLKRLKISKDDYYQDHITLLCNIACAIAKNLDWTKPETMEKIIYAAYIHDVLFADHTHLAEIRDIHYFEKIKSKLSDYEQKMFLENPQYVTQIAKEDPKSPPDVDKILLEHRELPDGSGFPRGLKHHQFSPLSCLFIIAHDFVDELYMNPALTMQEYMVIAKRRFKGASFEKVILAIGKSGNASL